MPRSAAQSDFVVVREVELPPRSEASARSTKIVMTATWIMLAILGILCAVGPHIPAGE